MRSSPWQPGEPHPQGRLPIPYRHQPVSDQLGATFPQILSHRPKANSYYASRARVRRPGSRGKAERDATFRNRNKRGKFNQLHSTCAVNTLSQSSRCREADGCTPIAFLSPVLPPRILANFASVDSWWLGLESAFGPCVPRKMSASPEKRTKSGMYLIDPTRPLAAATPPIGTSACRDHYISLDCGQGPGTAISKGAGEADTQGASRQLLDFLLSARAQSRLCVLIGLELPAEFFFFLFLGQRLRGGGGGAAAASCWRFDNSFHASVRSRHSFHMSLLPDGIAAAGKLGALWGETKTKLFRMFTYYPKPRRPSASFHYSSNICPKRGVWCLTDG